jgi:hypothetical protein
MATGGSRRGGSDSLGRALEAADAIELAGELLGPVFALLPQHGEPAQGSGPLCGLEPACVSAASARREHWGAPLIGWDDARFDDV